MADAPYPSKAPRRKRSHKSSLGDSEHSDHRSDATRRVGMACIACRKRKIRCDGAQPSCTHEENLEVKMKKRLAKLRKEQKDNDELDEPSPRLGTRRRWNRTISFDPEVEGLSPPSTSSHPAVSPSGLSYAAERLSLTTSVHEPLTAPAWSAPRRTSYFDPAYPHSPAAQTPAEEPGHGYFFQVAPAAASYAQETRYSTATYPLTPPMEDSMYAAQVDAHHDANCACMYASHAVQKALPQPPLQPLARPRPAFAQSRSAPQVPTLQQLSIPAAATAPHRALYGLQQARPSEQHTPALSPGDSVSSSFVLPPGQAAVVHSLGDAVPLHAPVPLREARLPAYVLAESLSPHEYSQQQQQKDEVTFEQPHVPASYRQMDAFLSPEPAKDWSAALVEDDAPGNTTWTEVWVEEQSRSTSLDLYNSRFEQVW
ncbi:hypothetical protein Rhopal_005255-T1 [Rhodotorula paludigena]|uniref:Zn(2)-C6 fungal-type domain-containing protein n=1 Tax=Rhodotorula paludigena TaxID=86838 RepID=A0AAV5GHX4_9BASI|nr:hypothetical protein Rhopal_005255-T1 [Rhodotorula paludigena]